MTLNENRPVDGEGQDWTSVSVRELVQHLATDEHSAIRAALQAIDQQLQLLLDEHDAENSALSRLSRVFSAFCRDIEQHMELEEAELFPAIEAYLDATEAGEPLRGSPLNAFGGPLRVMEHEHESTGAALRLMREFGHNYVVPGDSCPEYRNLMQALSDLEDRLLHHIYLENNILYPQAAALRPGRPIVPVSAPTSPSTPVGYSL